MSIFNFFRKSEPEPMKDEVPWEWRDEPTGPLSEEELEAAIEAINNPASNYVQSEADSALASRTWIYHHGYTTEDTGERSDLGYPIYRIREQN